MDGRLAGQLGYWVGIGLRKTAGPGQVWTWSVFSHLVSIMNDVT